MGRGFESYSRHHPRFPQLRFHLSLDCPPLCVLYDEMKKAPYSVRRDEGLEKAINALRRLSDPIPSVSDVIRDAVMEKYDRAVAPNGHGQRGKKERNGR